MSQPVIIDANRIFSELIAANHRLRMMFASRPDLEFVCPKYVLVELFKHKEHIAAASGLDEPKSSGVTAQARRAHPVLRRRRHQHRQLERSLEAVS